MWVCTLLPQVYTQAVPYCSGLIRFIFYCQDEQANTLLLRSWPGENVAGQTKRAVAIAMQITIGDVGAIAG